MSVLTDRRVPQGHSGQEGGFIRNRALSAALGVPGLHGFSDEDDWEMPDRWPPEIETCPADCPGRSRLRFGPGDRCGAAQACWDSAAVSVWTF